MSQSGDNPGSGNRYRALLASCAVAFLSFLLSVFLFSPPWLEDLKIRYLDSEEQARAVLQVLQTTSPRQRPSPDGLEGDRLLLTEMISAAIGLQFEARDAGNLEKEAEIKAALQALEQGDDSKLQAVFAARQAELKQASGEESRAERRARAGEMARFQGHLALRQGPEPAIEHFRTAIRLNPDDLLARANLALILTRPDQREEAMRQGKEALRLLRDFPPDPLLEAQLLGRLAALAVRGDDRDSAEHFYRQALEAAGDPPPIGDHAFLKGELLLGLGAILQRQEQENRAREDRDKTESKQEAQAGEKPALDPKGEAWQRLEDARSLADTHQDPVSSAILYGRLASIAEERRDQEAALTLYQASLEKAREAEDPFLQIASLKALARIRTVRRDYDKARAFLDQAMSVAAALNEAQGRATEIGRIHGLLGQLSLRERDGPAAEKHFREALALARSRKDQPLEAQALASLGNVARHAGKTVPALRYFHRAAGMFRDLGDDLGLAAQYSNIAAAEADRQHYDRAVTWYRRADSLYRKTGNKSGVIRTGLNLRKAQESLARQKTANPDPEDPDPEDQQRGKAEE